MKIGIISHYYCNRNCGGNLQAYALCAFINKKGYIAEQIDFDAKSFLLEEGRDISSKRTIKSSLKAWLKKPVLVCHRWLYNVRNNNRRKVYYAQKKRMKKIEAFNRKIPHSKTIYRFDTIQNAIKEYSVFITGSDQVWNPIWYKSAYFLDFVPPTYPKISYAASISQTKLTPYQQQIFAGHLKDFSAVSVREQEAVELLSDICPKKAKWVLDPTFLLSKTEWDNIASERKIEQDYIFCYFFSEDNCMRKLAQEFAAAKGCVLATIPHIFGQYRACDKDFGDCLVWDASPEDFISLIKYSKYVFTDSFHACVFSEIYQKEYVAFERSGVKGMGSRLESLTKIFDHEDRFLNNESRISLEYIKRLPKLDYSKESPLFQEMLKESIDFLTEALKEAKRSVK